MKALLALPLGIVALAGLVIVLAPIVVIAIIAFSPGDYLVFPPPGLSLRWFGEFFALPSMRNSFILSIELAAAAATLATMLATLAAIRLIRHRGRLQGAVQLLFMAPLVFPTIILGLALLLYFRMTGIGVLPGLLLAHVTIGLPYAFRLVYAQLQSLDPALEEAGQSLGAGPLRVFFQVTLPLIWPGILSGWLFAFIVSLGELNTALFLTSPRVKTLPIELFGYLQFEGNQLVVAAASTIQVGLIIATMLVIEASSRVARRRSAANS